MFFLSRKFKRLKKDINEMDEAKKTLLYSPTFDSSLNLRIIEMRHNLYKDSLNTLVNALKSFVPFTQEFEYRRNFANSLFAAMKDFKDIESALKNKEFPEEVQQLFKKHLEENEESVPKLLNGTLNQALRKKLRE